MWSALSRMLERLLLASMVLIYVAARMKPHMRSDTVCLQAASNITYDPVCASDGQTFQNFLAYKCYERFFNVHGLSARHGVCALRPEPNHCAFSFIVWRRVCSTDNITYSSIWELLCEGQTLGRPKQMLYEGPCRHRCPMSLQYDPVCGSNGIDYPNPEALKCASQMNPNITLQKYGPCSDVKVSQCREMMRSRYSGETPVCGSNGVTYPSHSAIMCLREHNPGLRIQHDGPCKMQDANLSMSALKICVYADNLPIWVPICGSDGVTYPNPYVMQCTIERGQISSDTEIDHVGECKNDIPVGREDPEDACREASVATPIIDKPLFCASDGRTYYNHKEYACSVQRDGDWFQYFIMRLGFPCEASDNPCERLRLVPEALTTDPICGSDDVTYANPLALMCAMSRNNNLRRHHKGACLSEHAEQFNGHGTSTSTTTESSENVSDSVGGSEVPPQDDAGKDVVTTSGADTKEPIEQVTETGSPEEAEASLIELVRVGL